MSDPQALAAFNRGPGAVPAAAGAAGGRSLCFSAPIARTEASPIPLPGAGSPWVDLAGVPDQLGVLRNFDGTTSSGWQGTGGPSSPYRLRFDGLNDVVVMPAGSVTELQLGRELTMRCGSTRGDPGPGRSIQYLVQWLQGYYRPRGMEVALTNARCRSTWTGSTGSPLRARAGRVYLGTTSERRSIRGPRQHRGLRQRRCRSTPGDGARLRARRTPRSCWGPRRGGLRSSYADLLRGLDSRSPPAGRRTDGSGSRVTPITGRRGPVHEPAGGGRCAAPTRACRARVQIRHSAATSPWSSPLPNSEPATIELIDVSGGAWWTEDVGSMGPVATWCGWVRVGTCRLVCIMLRLTQCGHALTAKATIMN